MTLWGENDPFVVNLKLTYGSEAKITYFENVSPAMDFIDMHMSERMIVFMDCKIRFRMGKVLMLWLSFVRKLRLYTLSWCPQIQ